MSDIRRRKKLSRVARIVTGSTPATADASNFTNDGIEWIKPDNLLELNGVTPSKQKVSREALKRMTLVPPGAVLVNCIGDVGKFGVLDRPVVTNQQINAVIFDERQVLPVFGKYLIASSKQKMQAASNKVVVAILNKTGQSSIVYETPTLSEQRKIGKLLDSKTTVIGKMIATKSHTHTQLSQLRQAIITDAVLGRGGTAVNLRHTDIPWIGGIPAHWQIEKIKSVADIVLGKMLQGTEKDGYSYRKYLRAQNIRWEKVDVTDVNEMWFSPAELMQYRLQKGDILVSEGGEVGRASMWNNELGECYIQNSVNRLRAKKDKVLPEYLLFVLESYGKAHVFENTVNRVSIAHLTREKLKEYYIPLPPLDEQRQVVADIQSRIQKLDTASDKLQRSIGQLEEYRTSLISNVITGKVKI